MITRLFFKTLPSTNLYLKENYKKLNHFTLVSAAHQTSGKGRLGRNWLSNDDATFSILLKDNLDSQEITKISLIVASSIFTILSKYGKMQIKWPNDILYQNKKIVGILSEAVISDNVECIIIGIGINCNDDSFDESISSKAISIKQIINKEIDINNLIREISIRFEKDYQAFKNGSNEWLKIVKENSNVIGKMVKATIDKKIVLVKAIDILENGNLLVLFNNKEKELFSGEITLEENY